MGIRPWEWDLMTVEQEDRILSWLDAYEEAQRKATDKLNAGR